jgi:hypothetical protein
MSRQQITLAKRGVLIKIFSMNSRQRFRETMAYGSPDRVPFFEEGIRADVIETWQQQGMPQNVSLASIVPIDERLELAPELLPETWPDSHANLDRFRGALDAADPARLPAGFPDLAARRQRDGDTLLLRVHHGLYQTLGVDGWQRFAEVNLLLKDEPDLVHEMLAIQAGFAADLIERILTQVRVDGAIFSEPICGDSGPLISPQMFDELINTSYEPLLDVLSRFAVELFIWRTYANARSLLPAVLKRGFNCLWASEVTLEAMDYRELRVEYGRDLRLIGGIDVDVLRQDQEAIRRELQEKVPALLQDGGYIPLADGRVRAVVPYENYIFYRKLLAEVVGDDTYA